MIRRPLAVLATLALLGACTHHRHVGTFGGRGAPDELAIGRQAPLVIPPDFNISPPKPGAPRPVAPDARTDALQALFPDSVTPKSNGETALLDAAGASRADPTARSTAGDPGTNVADKGGFVRKVVEAPVGGDAAVARVTPGG
jgi:hypothetical protein